MTRNAISRVYTDRSNCRRAAERTFGKGNYRIVASHEGFTYEHAEANKFASRFKTETAEPIYDVPPGLKRLREAPAAEELRLQIVAEQIEERRAAAARIARAAAANEPKTTESPKPAKDAPAEGTTARKLFDLICREEGATAKDCAAAGMQGVSVKVHALRFEARFPHLKAVISKEGAVDRVRLVRRELAA